MLRSSEKFAVIFFLAGSLLVMASFMGIETSTYLMNLIGQIAAFSYLLITRSYLGFLWNSEFGPRPLPGDRWIPSCNALSQGGFRENRNTSRFYAVYGLGRITTLIILGSSFAYLLFIVILVTLSISLIFGYFRLDQRLPVYFAIAQALVYRQCSSCSGTTRVLVVIME